MHYLGTNFSLTLGAWRLRFVLALEDAPDDDEAAPPAGRTPHHEAARPHPAFDTAGFDPHAAARYRI